MVAASVQKIISAGRFWVSDPISWGRWLAQAIPPDGVDTPFGGRFRATSRRNSHGTISTDYPFTNPRDLRDSGHHLERDAGRFIG